MKIRLTVVFALLVGLMSSSSISAHHGNAIYDMSKTETVTGTVTDFLLINPHASLSVNVKNDKGDVEHWEFESGGVRALVARGWTVDTLKPGDSVTVVFHGAKNGAHVGNITKITYSDGRELPLHPPQGEQ